MSAIQTKKRRPRQKPRSGSTLLPLTAFVAIIGAMALALPTVLLLCFGLLPALVAYAVDRTPQKYAARAVGFLNFAGVFPFLVKLWTGPNSIVAAMKILTDPVAWLAIYAAAAVGWLLYAWLPSVADALIAMDNARRLRQYEARQKKLVAEWGEAVAGRGTGAAKVPGK